MSIFFFENNEEIEVINLIKQHISLTKSSIDLYKEYIYSKDYNCYNKIMSYENEGDMIKKKVIVKLHTAFLPPMKRELSHTIKLLDEVLDCIKHGTLTYELIDFEIDNTILLKCGEILDISKSMLTLLDELLNIMRSGGDHILVLDKIKHYEEQVDDIYHQLYKYMVENLRPKTFWEGKLLCDCINYVVSMSDYIKEASDEIEVIYLNK